MDTKSGAITKIPNAVTSVRYVPDSQWWLVTLAEGAKLVPKQKYQLVLRFPTPSVVAIDTTETASLAVTAGDNQYLLTSHLGFQGDEPAGWPAAPPGGGKRSDNCFFDARDYTASNVRLNAICTWSNNVPTHGVKPEDLATALEARRGLDQVGQVLIQIDSVKTYQEYLPYQVERMTSEGGAAPLKDIFGNPVALDAKSKFTAQKAPTAKDAAWLYLNFNYAGGKGSKPGWVLDGKLSTPASASWQVRQFQIAPLFTADVGNNTVSNLTYTDTVDLGGSATRVFAWDRPQGLQEALLTLGTTYESDKEWDRDNLLATGDIRFNFAHFYAPQSVRTLQRFRSQSLRLLNDPNLKDFAANLKPEDVPPVFLGYALDFHLGIETGGSLEDTTVKATKGTAKENLPAYPIARVVPQIHGLLQLGRFSFDCTAFARYLATTENTVVQLSNNSLLLEHVSGWKTYGVLAASFRPDQASHFGITLSYKDGFAPPKFQRVNTVQIGVLLIY